MRIVVATHGHCFDGLASAAIFTHFLRSIEPGAPTFQYHACTYGPKSALGDAAIFDGDQNAMLDFQFSQIDSLNWYFDHHSTAFPTPTLREQFDARTPTGRYHFDHQCPSCARLIARVAVQKYGLQLGPLEALVTLADHIDSARFDSAHEAIDRTSKLSRFVALVERYGDSDFINQWVPRLLTQPVEVVAAHPDVERKYALIEREQKSFVEHLKANAIQRGPVVYADLTDKVHSTFAKFVTYAMFPESVYSVVVGKLPGATRLAVGYNPWSGKSRRHNLGELCQSHGGGGHAVVGGVAFALDATERAREVALSLVQALADG